MPLRSMMGARDFAKWGIKFLGIVNPPTHRTQAQYIIVAMDYLTKWVEEKVTTKSDARTIVGFLYKYVFTNISLQDMDYQ